MAVICSDSLSALVSLPSESSQNKPDLVYEIYESLYRIKHIELRFSLMWIPAHRESWAMRWQMCSQNKL